MTEQNKPTITRRTVATGAAWAAPVVALGVATPAYAASVCEDVAVVESSCNASSNIYRVRLTVTNNCDDFAAHVKIVSVHIGDTNYTFSGTSETTVDADDSSTEISVDLTTRPPNGSDPILTYQLNGTTQPQITLPKPNQLPNC